MTDLDGTLLDHYTYRYESALPALDIIKKCEIPLIFNSSKTAAEIIQIRKQLDVGDPFVVENGAGIYLPDINDTYKICCFGMSRDKILEKLNSIRDQYNLSFIGFNDMSDDELINHTQLSSEGIVMAKQREFSEPLLWQDNHENFIQFEKELNKHGLFAVQGGRFITVTSNTGKAPSIDWFKNYYNKMNNKQIIVIALGDSKNDLEMLQAADYKIMIKSPAHELPDNDIDRLIISNLFGPEGWNDSLLKLLSELKYIH